MALLLSSSVAIGVIILTLLKSPRGELHSYLLGDILAIGPQEVWLAAGLFVVVGLTFSGNLPPSHCSPRTKTWLKCAEYASGR